MRPGEAWNLKWTDIDIERCAVTVTPEKNSSPRQLKISSRLIGMLNTLPHRYEYAFRNPNTDPRKSMNIFRRDVADYRNRIAEKLQNPRINAITFKTLRHFKATMEYHRTKDILHVMQLLGHKNIRNTLVYTHLVNFEGDEYICKAAETVDEAKALVENGFDYVTNIDSTKLFRRRK